MKMQKGFTVIEAVLILVIVAILGGTGWYVYNSHNKTQDIYANADAANSSTVNAKKKSPSPAKDPTAGWTPYSSKDGVFSLKYPTGWLKNDCSGELLLGFSKETVGVCNSDFAGEILAISIPGDNRTAYQLKKDSYDNIIKSSETVNGVTGDKEYGLYNGAGAVASFPADKTQTTIYIFYTDNRTYILQYSKAPTYPDLLSDFNLMITKTLKFSS